MLADSRIQNISRMYLAPGVESKLTISSNAVRPRFATELKWVTKISLYAWCMGLHEKCRPRVSQHYGSESDPAPAICSRQNHPSSVPRKSLISIITDTVKRRRVSTESEFESSSVATPICDICNEYQVEAFKIKVIESILFTTTGYSHVSQVMYFSPCRAGAKLDYRYQYQRIGNVCSSKHILEIAHSA
jgi:hypothetical protein